MDHVIHIEFKFELSPVFHKGKPHGEAQSRSTRPRHSNNCHKNGSSNRALSKSVSDKHTHIHTHMRKETKTQRQVFKSGTSLKEKPFFPPTLPHEPTNFWHSYIFKHLALIFVQKKVNTKTYVTMISLFAYIIY